MKLLRVALTSSLLERMGWLGIWGAFLEEFQIVSF